MTIDDVNLTFGRFPLVTPYKVSSKVFHAFEPIVARVRTRDGREGWGEAIISRGYSHETPEGGWAFCREAAERMLGLDSGAARSLLEAELHAHPNAAAVLLSALDMLESDPLLTVGAQTRVPLLDPVHAMDIAALPDEIERLLARGFRTLKVKVGFAVDDDLARVAAIQRILDGRAEIRLDANRGFSREEGRRFAAALDPAGIQLFEQPCDADDWDANAAVAEVSAVPVMMDESIYGFADIERAAQMTGVGFVKLKLKKMGSVQRLKAGLERIRELGMRPVMGDGVATDICCWMEACVARSTLDNAGEMNGFLKLKTPLFAEPLHFEGGDIVLPAGFTARVDTDVLKAHAIAEERVAPARVAAPKARKHGATE